MPSSAPDTESVPTHDVGTRPEEAAAFLARQQGRIVLHCPEITLKGRNQKDFQQALIRNVRRRLQRAGYRRTIYSSRGRLYVVETDHDHQSAAEVEPMLALLAEVAGVQSLASAVWVRPGELRAASGEIDWPHIETLTIALARAWYRPSQSYAVRVKKVDKSLAIGARETEARLGAVVGSHSDWQRVNLDSPDRTFHFDFFPDGLYLYAEKYPGIGGLPSGTGGRMLALLSGGIDSPVAAFQLARRGATLDFFHLTAGHMTADTLETSVVGRLAARISCYCVRARLFAMPYTFFDLALGGDQNGYELVLFRRFMIRVAERLAARIGAGALITGDCLGQVASQTLENIAIVSEAGELPVLRPLIGTNKTAIIDLAHRIGTFEISIEPYKDCCALLASNPRTRCRLEPVKCIEAKRLPDYDRVLEQTLNETICIEYDCGKAVRHTTLAEAAD